MSEENAQNPPEFTTISVQCDGASAAWVLSNTTGEAIFSGNPDMAKAARTAAILEETIPVFDIPIQANDHSELGALAALFAYDPARTIVLQGTKEIDEFIDFVAGEDESLHAELLEDAERAQDDAQDTESAQVDTRGTAGNAQSAKSTQRIEGDTDNDTREE